MLFTVAAISAGLALAAAAAIAGLFWGFSNSVMPAFDAIEPERATDAMRSINEKILNPKFYATFIGGPIIALVAGGLLLALGEVSAAWAFFGSGGVQILGTIVFTTGAVNVPMNNALLEGKMSWQEYSPRWTRWNTARAWTSLLGVLLAGLGLYLWALP